MGAEGVTTSASGTLLRARERCGDQSHDGRVRRDEHVAAAETRVGNGRMQVLHNSGER